MSERLTAKRRSLVLGALLAVGLWGWLATGAMAAQYGTAVVEEGEMTILREGRALSFRASPTAVPVNEQDLVRVRAASRIVLKTRDRATLTLGANAVFQCEPWQAPSGGGVFRMLFGRFRAAVSGLAGGERFAVKTATATIGVKGTEFFVASTAGGNTAVLGVENNVSTAGSDGVEQNVGPNQVSAVVGDNPASQSVTAPDDFKNAMNDVNSPSITSNAALNLPGENFLINAGILSKDALDKSKSNAPPQGQQGTTQTPTQPSINLDDAQQAAGAVHGKLNLNFQK